MSEPDNLSIVVVGNERVRVPAELPVLPVRDVVVFPGVTCRSRSAAPRSLAALEDAGDGGFLIVATQRDPSTENPALEDLHPIGCIVRVVRVIDARREGKQAIVRGRARARGSPRPPGRRPRCACASIRCRRARARAPSARPRARACVELAHRVIDLHDDYPRRVEELRGRDPDAGPARRPDRVERAAAARGADRAARRSRSPVARLAHRRAHLEREVTIAETQRALRRRAATSRSDPEQPRAPAAPAPARHRGRARRGRRRRARGRRAAREARGGEAAARRAAQADRELQRLSRAAAARARPPPDPHLPRVARRPAVVDGDRGQARPRGRARACSTTTTTTSRR